MTGGCWLEVRKLTLQSPSITVEFSVRYNLKIASLICFRAWGTVLGDGAKALLTDWDKITSAVSF